MFNIEEFDIKLDTEFIGRNFVYCEEINSTNAFLTKTKDYQQHGTVLLAEFQTEGKGRKNREWVSNREQNLTFSILLKNEIKADNISIINLGAALSVAQSLENLYQFKVDLKWPNDVLVDDKKIAGILAESSSKGSSIERLVIGFGINVNQANFTGKFNIIPTSVRREFHNTVSREKLLSEVLNNFEEIFNQYTQNPEIILRDWKSRSKLIGEKIKITEGEVMKFGLFEDIDEKGFMILKTEKGKEKIHFGDVSLIQ